MEKGAENTSGLPEIDQAAPSATGSAPDGARLASAPQRPAAGATIPPALHGRWALAPNDCTSTSGDAKGLLTISAGELRFYESVAVPGNEVESGTDSISGSFNFTGEGQEWTRFQSLELQGRNLIRTESNPAASFSYAKCD